jgi:hypothetical protein
MPHTSQNAVFHVLSYTPHEGEGGTPISVRIHFHPAYSDILSVRLILAHTAVHTTVREITDATTYGTWQLDALAPPFDSLQAPSTKVLMSVQALNEEHAILDTLTFGEFTYWTPGIYLVFPTFHCLTLSPDSSHTSKKPKLHVNTSSEFRTSPYLPTPSPTSPPYGKPEVSLHRRTKAESSLRPGKGNQTVSDLHAQTPILDLVTPLQSICVGWSQAEVHAGRRLVRFSKIQDGRRLTVSCEPIKPEDYRELDSVISCIYREESDSCYVTSVDIIFLLERLTNSEFPVEEKNRIRRNLEGLRPTTVSKHKPGFEDFFQRIMEFPDPKPRNIEKDLKVFEWALLDQALDKILSKYVSAPPLSPPLNLTPSRRSTLQISLIALNPPSSHPRPRDLTSTSRPLNKPLSTPYPSSMKRSTQTNIAFSLQMVQKLTAPPSRCLPQRPTHPCITPISQIHSQVARARGAGFLQQNINLPSTSVVSAAWTSSALMHKLWGLAAS